jgi:hypothetical protein
MKVSAVTSTKQELLGIPVDALTMEEVPHHAATTPPAFSALDPLAGSGGPRRSCSGHPPRLPAHAIDHEDGPYHLGWLLHAWPPVRATGLVTKAAAP